MQSMSLVCSRLFAAVLSLCLCVVVYSLPTTWRMQCCEKDLSHSGSLEHAEILAISSWANSTNMFINFITLIFFRTFIWLSLFFVIKVVDAHHSSTHMFVSLWLRTDQAHLFWLFTANVRTASFAFFQCHRLHSGFFVAFNLLPLKMPKPKECCWPSTHEKKQRKSH